MTYDNHSGEVDAFGRKVPADKLAVPRHLVLARWLWIASTVAGLLRSFIQLSDRGMLISELHRQAPQLAQDQLDAAANSGILFTLVMSLAVFGIYLMLANRMVQGRNWARVLMTVLGALSVLGTLFTLIGVVAIGPDAIMRATGVRVDIVDTVFSVIVVGLDASVLALLYRPDSNRFFRDAANLRRAARNGV